MPKWLIVVAMVVGGVGIVLGLIAKAIGSPVLAVTPRAYVDLSVVAFLAAIALELYPGKK